MGILRIAVAAILIISAGVVHGTWTNRWGMSPGMTALAARFDSVPMVIGDWKATPSELGSREKKLAGVQASLSRVYTNASRGVSVSVVLIGGVPGDIATHTPDVCYPGAGYTLNVPTPYEFRPGPDGPRTEFRTAVASKGGANPSTLRILWSWHSSKGWAAPEDARWRFATEPALCKLYVIRNSGGADVPPERDPCNDFLGAFLPEVNRTVFAKGK
jgi:hypothetical protein